MFVKLTASDKLSFDFTAEQSRAFNPLTCWVGRVPAVYHFVHATDGDGHFVDTD